MPYGPGYIEENELELARVLRASENSRSTLVVIGQAENERSRRMQDVLEAAGSRVLYANDSGDVANAILRAAESCTLEIDPELVVKPVHPEHPWSQPLMTPEAMRQALTELQQQAAGG
jgi:hypothetical protein